LEAVSRLAAPGSWLGCDVINHAVLSSSYTKPWIDMQAQAGAPDANYGRWTPPVLPTDAPELPHNWYVTARKGA